MPKTDRGTYQRFIVLKSAKARLNMKNVSTKDLHDRVMTLVKDFDPKDLLEDMELVGDGQKLEIQNKTGKDNLYYQWLACLTQLIKPKQVVELGAASGISTICISKYLPTDSEIYSVDIDPQIAWKWMSKYYPQLTKILSDDRDMTIWEGIDLNKTDLWFFDSLHTEEQLSAEIKLYSPFWKKGSIVVFDDIHINEGMERVWNSLKYEKFDNSDPLHYSGFGFLIA